MWLFSNIKQISLNDKKNKQKLLEVKNIVKINRKKDFNQMNST